MPMQRRTFLTTVAASTAALAGCGGSDTDDSASGGTASNNDDSANSDDTASSDGGAAVETEAQTQTAEPTPTPDPTEEQPDVKILDHEMTTGTFGARVSGMVQNTSGRELRYIEVKAVFFDSDDVRIGEGMWNATEVPPGQKLKFETIPASSDDDPARYEITAGTGGL